MGGQIMLLLKPDIHFTFIGAFAPSQPAVNDVELVRHVLLADACIRYARDPHPRDGVAAVRPCTVGAEDRIIAPHKMVGAVDAMPRVSFSNVDTPGIIAVQILRRRPRSGRIDEEYRATKTKTNKRKGEE